ncbi:hypothetical protein [Planobispora rosea]|nr:hypothetical protein [Planobispora rosea]
MAYEKMTITLPDHLATAVRASAEAAGMQISPYIARALRSAVLSQQLATTPLPADAEWAEVAEAEESGTGEATA